MESVSIITPSFNQADFLESTILSVLNQGYQELEYIVIDGGSTDGSVQIIEKYGERLAWWTSEPDDGQADAINKGFKHASGEFIAWLNSDDLYLPAAIDTAIHALSSDKRLGMVFGNAITIDQMGKPLNQLNFGDWGLEDLMAFRIICQPAVFMRRKAIEDTGFIDPTYHFMLDHHLWIRIASRYPIKHIDSIIAASRFHSEAKNVALASEFGKETMRILDWMETQTDLAHILEKNRKQIVGGAHRLNARYLLDGDQPSDALKAYRKSITSSPGYALKHWHRMLYACLSLIGPGSLINRYHLINVSRRRKTLSRLKQSELVNWPGINIES